MMMLDSGMVRSLASSRSTGNLADRPDRLEVRGGGRVAEIDDVPA